MMVETGNKIAATLLAPTLLALALLGCGAEETSEPSYFPLNQGFAWTYDINIVGPSGRQNETLTIANSGATDFKEKSATVRSTGYGTDYLIQADDSGIYRVAKRTLTEAEPVGDEPRRYVLKRPYSIGASWSNWTRLYLTVFNPPTGTLTNALFYEKPFLMTYVIESLNAAVTVPAGTFYDCILVVGTADLTLYLDAKLGYVSVPITTREWYAAGVGLVKLERLEKVDGGFYKGGGYQMELTQFSRG